MTMRCVAGETSFNNGMNVIQSWVKPTSLETELVRLEPLTMQHVDEFYQAGSCPDIWRWSLPDKCSSIETTRSWIEYSVNMMEQRHHIAFAIYDKKTNKFVGSTRYCSIKSDDRNVEIGFTFITPAFQRSYINTHAKYCLLTHAFEQLGAIRVEFKTHQDNNPSRNAILRLGATFEGMLRNQRILSDGSYRNTAIFSIIDSEWSKIKVALEDKL